MMLHAHQLIFNHPITNEQLILNAKINEEFSRVGTILNLDLNKYEIAMTEAVANINEDLAIPYSYKKQILSTYE
jgi:hypothetical protein